MLSEYQSAILAEMGITQFVNQQDNHAEQSQAPQYAEDSAAQTTISGGTEQAKVTKNPGGAIKALRNALGAKASSEKASPEKESSDKTSQEEAPAEDVKRISQTYISQPNGAITKDILHFFAQQNFAVAPANGWAIDEHSPAQFGQSSVCVPYDLVSLSTAQKRQLWLAMTKAVSAQ